MLACSDAFAYCSSAKATQAKTSHASKFTRFLPRAPPNAYKRLPMAQSRYMHSKARHATLWQPGEALTSLTQHTCGYTSPSRARLSPRKPTIHGETLKYGGMIRCQCNNNANDSQGAKTNCAQSACDHRSADGTQIYSCLQSHLQRRTQYQKNQMMEIFECGSLEVLCLRAIRSTAFTVNKGRTDGANKETGGGKQLYRRLLINKADSANSKEVR